MKNNKENAKRYFKRHQARIQERRKHDEKHQAAKRDYHLRKRYGISQSDYEWMLLEQGGRCAVCLATDPGVGDTRSQVFDIDHDHETGRVRGLLCRTCNVTLGQVEKVLKNRLLADAFKRYLKL